MNTPGIMLTKDRGLDAYGDGKALATLEMPHVSMKMWKKCTNIYYNIFLN